MIELPACPWGYALFLDFDGTLVELKARPEEVTLPRRVAVLLRRLQGAHGGALALISGRTVVDLNQLIAPLRLPLAGLHGLERRDASGHLYSSAGTDRRLDGMRQALVRWAEAYDGVYVEDKGLAIAVHYRSAPLLGDTVRAFLQRQCRETGTDLHIQPGKYVYELKPRGQDKGTAVTVFLGEAPFRHRLPIYLGDDHTDEYGFAAVNAAGGVSIRVGADGTPSQATWHLQSVSAALTWLESLPARSTQQ